MGRLILEHALLPDGWAERVGVTVADGWITAVEVDADDPAAERIPGIALAGMPNLHSHTFQRGMAGLAETRGPGADSFWTWREVMYRFLGALDPDDVEAIAAFAMVEMLEGGFTSLAEFHYLHHAPDGRPYADPAELAGRIAAAAAETGIGLTLLPVFYAQGGFGGQPPGDGQRRFVSDVDAFCTLLDRSRAALAGLDDAALGVAPHSLRAVTPETLTAVTEGAAGPVHIHAAEQVAEVEACLAWSGQRPVAWLLDHAAVDGRWTLIHATQMTRDETLRLAASGATAGLCPITEASLGDGIFDGAAFLGAGGRFGVGSDSNVEITAPGELRQLEYSQRLRDHARNVLGLAPGRSTGRALYEGALAGGRAATGRRVGAIAPGRRADIVVLRRDDPDLATVAGDRWLDTVVFVSGRRAVDRVYVGGRCRVESGRHAKRAEIAARYTERMRRLVGR